MKKGFTLLEILLVAAIVLIIASIIVRAYSLFNVHISLKGDASKIASMIYRAKSDTIGSRGGLQYGVHFESDRAVLFQGTTYLQGASTNENFILSAHISIGAINLTGGGSNIIFDRLTGVTAESGSITIGSDIGTAVSTINISKNGIVDIQ